MLSAMTLWEALTASVSLDTRKLAALATVWMLTSARREWTSAISMQSAQTTMETTRVSVQVATVEMAFNVKVNHCVCNVQKCV